MMTELLTMFDQHKKTILPLTSFCCSLFFLLLQFVILDEQLLVVSGIDLLSSHDCQDLIVLPVTDRTVFPGVEPLSDRSLRSIFRTHLRWNLCTKYNLKMDYDQHFIKPSTGKQTLYHKFSLKCYVVLRSAECTTLWPKSNKFRQVDSLTMFILIVSYVLRALGISSSFLKICKKCFYKPLKQPGQLKFQ